MKIDRISLVKTLNTLKPILNDTSKISKIFTMFCFRGKTVEVFNGVQGMKVDIETDFTGCVAGKEFLNILESYSVEEIDLTKKEDKLIVKAGKSKATFILFPEEDFIKFGIGKKKKLLFVMSDDFIEGLKKCQISVAKDDLREQQYGIALINDCLYSTDNARISKYKLDINIKSSLLLPPTFYEQLIKLYDSNNEPLSIFIENDTLECGFDKIKLYTKVNPNLVLLEYERVLAKYETKKSYNRITDEFIECVGRINIIGKSSNVIDLNVDAGKFIISATSNTCDAVEEIEIEDMKNETFTCSFNSNKLMSSLKVIKEFKFIENGTTVVLIGKDDKFIHVLSSLVR